MENTKAIVARKLHELRAARDMTRFCEHFPFFYESSVLTAVAPRSSAAPSHSSAVIGSRKAMAGADKTRRRDLTYMRRLALSAGKPMTGMVTGAKGRVVRREMEASKW